MKKSNIIEDYIEVRPLYKKLAEKVSQLIEEVLEINNINYHIVTFRAKTIESFADKIDNPKYDDPLNQLTDLAGIRIIGYVEDDINKISELIRKHFEIDKKNSLDKSVELGTDKVGYKSVHYICQLKKDRTVLPEYSRFKNLNFEIQIRTILQHSWAEIEHDKNYKFSGDLPSEIKRRFKLIAGNLEILDREFNQLSLEIDKYSRNVKAHTRKGELDIPINSTSLKEFLKVKFKNAVNKNLIIPDFNGSDNERKVIQEMKDFGLNTLADLEKIIPEDFEKIIMQKERSGNFLGLVRNILLIEDASKYMNSSWKSNWAAFSSGSKAVLEYYDTDIALINSYL